MMTNQFNLIDPPAPVEKPKSWQQTFAGIFWFNYKEATLEECKLGFGALKKMLNTHAVKFWVDEETGKPEVPSVEQWTEEVEAFFQDEFAAAKRGFHFSYLLSQYGSFKKYKPTKRTAETDLMITKVCGKCQHVMKYPRSFWMKSKNKVGRCSKCNTGFNVNDVLNQIPALNNILPLVTGANHDTNTNQ